MRDTGSAARAPEHGLIDISMPVSPSTPEWPGDTPFAWSWALDMASGDSVNASRITTSPHVGTHADAPLHVRENAQHAYELPLRYFTGPSMVLGIEGPARDVSWSEIEHRVTEVPERLLLRTGVSIAEGSFPEDWPALDADCVRQLISRGLRLLGTEAPSVDRRHSRELATHHAIFDGGAVNLENLRLAGVADGWYELIAFPAAFDGLDAAPVRAILRETGSR